MVPHRSKHRRRKIRQGFTGTQLDKNSPQRPRKIDPPQDGPARCGDRACTPIPWYQAHSSADARSAPEKQISSDWRTASASPQPEGLPDRSRSVEAKRRPPVRSGSNTTPDPGCQISSPGTNRCNHPLKTQSRLHFHFKPLIPAHRCTCHCSEKKAAKWNVISHEGSKTRRFEEKRGLLFQIFVPLVPLLFAMCWYSVLLFHAETPEPSILRQRERDVLNEGTKGSEEESHVFGIFFGFFLCILASRRDIKAVSAQTTVLSGSLLFNWPSALHLRSPFQNSGKAATPLL